MYRSTRGSLGDPEGLKVHSRSTWSVDIKGFDIMSVAWEREKGGMISKGVSQDRRISVCLEFRKSREMEQWPGDKDSSGSDHGRPKCHPRRLSVTAQTAFEPMALTGTRFL